MADNKKEVERAFESTSVRISPNKKALARRQKLILIKLDERLNHHMIKISIANMRFSKENNNTWREKV